MSLRDFYKEHYMLEVSRRQELTNSVALPVGVLSILVGSILIIAKEIDFPLDMLELFQLAIILVSVLLFSFTLYFLIRSYFNYKYEYIATSKEIMIFKKELVAYYISVGHTQEDAEKQAEQETLENIDSQYALRSDKNACNNDKKSYYLHKANEMLVYSIISTIISGIPYVINSIVSPAEIYKTELVNLKEFKSSNQYSIQQLEELLELQATLKHFGFSNQCSVQQPEELFAQQTPQQLLPHKNIIKKQNNHKNNIICREK